MRKKKSPNGKKNGFTRSHAIKSKGGVMGLKIRKAHKHTFRNRKEIEASEVCGCGSCARVFPVSEIKAWADEGETAICPYCDVDILIGDASGIPLTEEFLNAMAKKYF